MNESVHKKVNYDGFTIALTGGIASGKTVVSTHFQRLGASVIDLDDVARFVVKTGTLALRRIEQQFGHEFITQDGNLDREKMRNFIFAQPSARRRLENIIHPLVHDEALKRLQKVDEPYCILVIPLFVESPRYFWLDRVLVIDVPEETQIQRLMDRDRVDRKHAEAILAAQASRQERLAIANDVIKNVGDNEDLKREVEVLHKMYLAFAAEINN